MDEKEMNLFYDFAVPARLSRCQTSKEILRLINTWNGILNCYLSVNPYEVINIDGFGNEITRTYVKKIFFDIDNNDTISAKKMIVYLLQKDLKFEIFHSGGGYHIYIHCKENDCPENMRIAQLSILHETQAIVDMHCVGDLRRVSRIPNTWNFRSKSFCVPIKVEDIGKEGEKGLEQRFIDISYGNNYLDLSSFTEENYEYLKPEIVPNLNINGDILLIPCMRNIISIINPRHDQRFLLAVYLSFAIRNGKDLWNFDSKSIIEKIMDFMKTNCTYWIDFSESKTRYYLNNIIPKFNPTVNCRFIKSKGCCIECGYKDEI